MMEPVMMKDEHQHHHNQHYSPTHFGHHNPWADNGGSYSPHTQSPATDYGYQLPSHSAGMPMEPAIQHSMAPLYSSSHTPQSLYTTQWPSMLTNPPLGQQGPPHYHHQHPILPRLTTHTGSSRRTLTDQDRRRMCQYHEDHPNVKQTEIGAMFGVERSTVSKVLRQKDKYLSQDSGERSPIRKAKGGKFPDIERALANWARNHQKSGLPLSDSIIREKARFFASTVGSTDCSSKVNSTSWLEKFKQKNHLVSPTSRKGSDASDLGLDTTCSGNATPNGLSPISPTGYIPSSLSNAQSSENLKSDSPDSYGNYSGMYKHGQGQSATSLASGYTDATAPSSFSPHSPTSPFFLQDMNKMNQGAAVPLSGGQGYPSQAEPYNGSAMMNNHNIPTPVEDYTHRNLSISCDIPQSHPGSKIPSVQSSPAVMFPPANILSGMPPPSQDDARKALEVVMQFFQQQPTGVFDVQEYITMNKLMEKLKVQGSVGELPGGMHSIDLQQSQKEMSRKRSIQGII